MLNSTTEHSKAYTTIYKNTGIRNCKVTHDRTVAIQNMSGLTPYQISSFTKHIVDNKLSASYLAEADREACLHQSGFGRGEEWFVPEAFIPLSSVELHRWEMHLLPKIRQWRQQRARNNGDKTECASNFLDKTVPFLVEVAVQCGIFFVRDFPEHPLAQLLLSFPGYELWSQQKRQWCQQLSGTRDGNEMELLGNATRGAFERLNRRVESLEPMIQQLLEQNRVLTLEVRRLLEQHQEHHNDPQQEPPPQPAPAVVPPLPALVLQPRAPAVQQHQQHQPQQEPQQPQQPAQQPQEGAINFLSRFRQVDRRRLPVMQTKMPASFSDIHHEWLTEGLEDFRSTRYKSRIWPREIYNRYKKRMDILGKIKELAEADGVSVDAKIRILDSERLQRGKTADSYLRDWDEERRQVNGRQRAVPEQQRRRRRQVDVAQHHAPEQQDHPHQGAQGGNQDEGRRHQEDDGPPPAQRRRLAPPHGSLPYSTINRWVSMEVAQQLPTINRRFDRQQDEIFLRATNGQRHGVATLAAANTTAVQQEVAQLQVRRDSAIAAVAADARRRAFLPTGGTGR